MASSFWKENLSILRINEFQNPQKIIFGVDAVEKVGEEANRLGGGKIIVISDGNIEKAGILSRILKRLEENEVDITVLLRKDPSAEPTMKNARTIAKEVRLKKYNIVIGVGGGSCLDSAKLAAAMATNPGDIREYCAKVKGDVREVKNDTLPKILIPTTAGTGSEASNTLVLIDKEYKTWITHNKVLAEVAVVDPALTLTLPAQMTAGSGMDALSHVVEALMSTRANPISDALSLEAVNLIFANLRQTYYHGKDLEARWNMSLAAFLGGWVIGFPWIGGPANIGHCVAEAVGSKYGIPHGIACAIALPYAMEYNLPAMPEKLALIASTMGEDIADLSLRKAAVKSIEAVFNLMEEIDLPTSLKEFNVPQKDLKSLAEYIINERQYLYDLQTFSPRKPTHKNIVHLLERMWEGKK